MTTFSLVIPCYNDAARLQQGVELLRDALTGTAVSWDFVFVEDHSRDDTAAELERCVEWLQSRGVTASAIYLDHNHGHGGAVSSGLRAARGEIVGYVELDPSLARGLVPMIERVHRGAADIVVGRRVFAAPLAVPFRFLSHTIYRWYAFSCLRLPVSDPECRLKVFRRSALLPILDAVEDQHCFWDTELLDRGRRGGLVITEVPIAVKGDERARGGPLLRTARNYVRAMNRYRTTRPGTS